MDPDSGVSSMLMYEDESVDVRYVDGSQLQLSPCGSEFLLVKAPDPSSHPLLPRERLRQRTRFTISPYKAMIRAALAFRNKYASEPYLPLELIPAESKKFFFSIDPDVTWPEFFSCEAELGPGGETVIRCEEGRGAALMLSPSGEEFSVEFPCRLSQARPHRRSAESPSGDADSRPDAKQHPEETHQSTPVVQRHSCFAFPPTWRYPLSLARHHWVTRVSPPEKAGAEGTKDSAPAEQNMNMSLTPSEERRSRLPQALALTCVSPHRHRWRSQDEDAPAELMKVMWCQGVTYRILNGAVSIIEASLGDGSVIRSHGVLNTYFTHLRPEIQSGQVKEISYRLNNLPPDVVGQPYSICSIVNRASRILACYEQAKLSLTLTVAPSCLQEAMQARHFSTDLKENLAPVVNHVDVTQTEDDMRDLVTEEVEKIRRFNYLLENCSLKISLQRGRMEAKGPIVVDETHEPVTASSIAEALQRTSKAIQDIDALTSLNI